MDVIEKVGPRGQYLGHPHTLAHFRRLYQPRMGDRSSYETWDAAARPEIVAGAHAEVERILASRPAPPLPERTLRELVAIEDGIRHLPR